MTSQRILSVLRLMFGVIFVATQTIATVGAQSFVRYGDHDASYGSHTLDAADVTWVGGPATVTVNFDSDGSLTADGENTQAQRTARNGLRYTSPSAASNPQSFDNLDVINVYGDQLPLLQQLSGSGVSTLSYAFDAPVAQPLDLFITDVDDEDTVALTALDAAGLNVDVSTWAVVGEGDLSVFKNTGTDFSTTVAPLAVINRGTANLLTLTAADSTNYNRSYTILRTTQGEALSEIRLTFDGDRNTPSRDLPGSGSHIYVALSTAAVPEPMTATWLAAAAMLIAMRRRR